MKKKILIIIAIVLVLLVAAMACGDSDSDSGSTGNNTDSSVQSADQEEPEADATKYKDGTYIVGSDIPAGEYCLFASSSIGAYMEVSSDSSGNLESIIANENFTYNDIITLTDGQYLKLQGAEAVPFAEADIDTSGNGMFKVGTNLAAGEYKIVMDENNSVGYAYIEVSTASNGQLDSIRTNDNITGDSYITVNDGEYLKLTGCHIG